MEIVNHYPDGRRGFSDHGLHVMLAPDGQLQVFLTLGDENVWPLDVSPPDQESLQATHHASLERYRRMLD